MENNTLSVEAEVEAFKRRLLAERMSRCTPEQVAFFNDKIFPASRFPKGVPADKLSQAIDLFDRTIRKNLAGR